MQGICIKSTRRSHLLFKYQWTRRQSVLTMYQLCQILPTIYTQSRKRRSHCILVFFNAKSINNKALLLKDFFVDQKLDLMALTETWTKSDSFKTTGELCPWGYGFFHVPGSGREGGGVGLTARASAFENKKTQNSHHLSLWRFYHSHQNIV